MKRGLCFTLILLLCLAAPASTVFAKENADSMEANDDKVYRSATEYDYPPYSVTESGEADGFSVELLKAVARESGLRLSFRIGEWAVIKEELKNGELDVLPLVSYSEERDEYYDFTVPYIVMYGNIFVRADNETITSEEDLLGKEIAVMEGDTAHEYALKMNFTDQLILTSTFQEAFQLLDDGQYDAVLAQSLVGSKIIDDMGLKNVKAVNKLDDDGVSRIKTRLSGFEQKFCFAVREGNKELLSKLNEGLAVVSVNGTYNRLYEKWFPFLIDNQPSMKEIIKYLTYIMIPTLLLMMIVFVIIVKREVKRKTWELKSANEAKSRFLANMSHELRTPLNAILGYSALMQKDVDLSEQEIKNLKIISKSGNHLLTLINDILEIAKIESRKSTLKNEPFDFHQLVRDIEAMFALEVNSKKLYMEIQGVTTVPRYVVGDTLKLRIILINLLGNAIKFTEKGGVKLSFSVEEQRQEHFRLRVEVEDTGVGIAEDEREKLFQLFSQTESGLNTTKGTGLGLVISQECVRLMNGKIQVESTPGMGSTFYFTIELQEAATSEIIKEEAEHHVGGFRIPKDVKRPVILIAEDTADSRALLVRMLTEAGCEVHEAENGEQAVALAQKYRPDFIWMDIRMPVMDGLDATRFIKGMEPDYVTVIVAISAHVFKEESESILAAGCDDVLTKPFSEFDVFRIMEKHLNIVFVQESKAEERVSTALKTLEEEDRMALKEALILLEQDDMLAIVAKIHVTSPEVAEILSVEIEAMNFTMMLKQFETN